MIDISNITSEGPHLGSNRSTKYEVLLAQVGPNAVGCRVVERGVRDGKPIDVDVPEDLYTPAQIQQIQAALSLLEEGARVVQDGKEAELKLAGIDVPRAEVQKLVAAADDAKAAVVAAQLESARIEAENIVKRAEAEQLDADLATLRAAVAAPVQAEVAAPETEAKAQ